MKIAILGPSPVPFTIGGVENLLWGLCETINQKTPHQAELIKLPSKEYDFWSLIDSYYLFYTLDLSHFDAVICTKYPAWMIEHKNCVYYIQHRLRGLYDTYHLTRLPEEVERENAEINKVLIYTEKNPHPRNLDAFFGLLRGLREIKDSIPQKYFEFPGPFIRKIVHYMDDYAVAKNRDAKFFSISNTVKNRREYFPPNAKVDAVYHPSFLKRCTYGEYKHIFIVSRLDGAKRVDMLIQAMRYVQSDVKLYIAGTGPLEKQLKEMAAGDGRIEFLGFVNDDEIDRYYADSLVVPFFPYDEDYGLITIEAMMHKKPVITTIDSGGPTEFVVDNETGYCVRFDAKEIGEKIDFFAKNPGEAERMGVNALAKVKDITWENTVNRLLNGHTANAALKDKKKITVATNYAIYPPQGGGQARIFNLYKHAAEKYDIEIVDIVNTDQKGFTGYIADSVREIRVPKSQIHQQKEWDDFESKLGAVASDVALLALSGNTPEYGRLMGESIRDSDIVVVSHPYAYPEVKKCLNGKRFIYEAHNVESQMKREYFGNTPAAKKVIQLLFEVEAECCLKSEFIMACSMEDRDTLCKMYGVDKEKIIVVPNGVDCGETVFTPLDERLACKRSLGLGTDKMGLFMGSWHGPNIEACKAIIAMAPECPDVKFLLMGSQCRYFEKQRLPGNVGLLGLVSEEVKNRVFSVVDFALNPMLSGSGTNLKMFDYMAAGIPVITTEFGARGIDGKTQFIIADIGDMPKIVNEFDIRGHSESIGRAREYVEDNFDWSAITKILVSRLDKCFA